MRLVLLFLVLTAVTVGIATFAYHRATLSHGAPAPTVTTEEEDGYIRHNDPVEFPQVAFTDLHGSPVSIADFRGKMVLVNFWASWCAPCLEEMPDLAAISQKYAGKGLVVIAISQDIDTQKSVAAEKVRAFLIENSIALDAYLDPGSKAFDQLKVDGLPHSFLLDRQGREILRIAGPLTYHREALDALITEMIGL